MAIEFNDNFTFRQKIQKIQKRDSFAKKKNKKNFKIIGKSGKFSLTYRDANNCKN